MLQALIDLLAVTPCEQASKEAVEQRAVETEILFGPITKTLDHYCFSTTQLPPILARVLRKFCDNVTKEATKHFELRNLDPLPLPRLYPEK
ncbi:hypothetical protein EV44_g1754 [Erysiphe necator]|uniref:Uncharacterized protein n=1 Tax=Uncinula necator TaxID=52586 RepID=A0A0B1P3M1_UNCNE|nr:hypothetical protein EV44_g1754 [Erysiphe necator]